LKYDPDIVIISWMSMNFVISILNNNKSKIKLNLIEKKFFFFFLGLDTRH